MEPLLKWAGGKRWQVPLLKRIFYPYRERVLVEPFCGALAVTLGLEPIAGATCNDINPHLINFYKQVQRGLKFDLDLEVGDYYSNRDWFNALIKDGKTDTPEAAMLFWYLNRFGFNGLCRFNGDGEFNVPIGRASSEVKPWSEHLARHYLSRYTFTCGDWGAVTLSGEEFVYADPPYDDGFTNYSGNEFGFDDQMELAETLKDHPAAIITNHATDRMLELYRDHGYHTLLLDAPRRIAASGDRTPAKEVLASTFPVDARVTIGVPQV